MSLQIWLPLNGNTKNQGLSNITISSTTGTQENGKIGKCYKGVNLNLTNLGNLKVYPMTISFWVKTDSSGTWQQIIMFDDTSLSQIHGIYIADSARLKYEYNPSLNANNIISTEWHHYCFIINSGNNKVYYDGVLINSSTETVTNETIGRLRIAPNTNIYLNDVRIYDHCLSEKEIKLISQGLVLHYPLNNNGYGRKNNIAITNITNRSCTNFSYNSITNEWTMTCPTGSSSWGYGIYINNSSIKWKANETWIISMEVYVPKTINWQRDINNKPDLSDISGYTGNDYDVNAQRYVYTNDVGNQILKPGWNKIWFSQTAPDTYGLSNSNTNWGIVTTNETSNIDIKIRNIKGEIASIGEVIKPTTWSPNIQDSLEQDNIIYDTSGYCNNGTARGTLVTSNDTSKYDCSTEFNGTDNTILVPYDANIWQTNFTINIWFKKNELGTKNYETLFGGPAGFEMDTRSNSATTLTLFMASARGGNITGNNFSSFNFSEWYMVTLVNDGTNELYYVNGNFVKSITKKSMPVGQYYIGSWNTTTSQNYKGLISDFRIYATALSAEDIAGLYSVGASIDNQGNVYSAMIQEV